MAAGDPRHPKSSFAARYPYNQKIQYEGGHELEFDNTPNAERIRLGHRSGTYFEISPDGRKVDLIVGNHHQYVKGGLTVTVDNNRDTKITGHDRFSIGGDTHVEVVGDKTMAIGGLFALNVNENKVETIGKKSFVFVGGDAMVRYKGQYNLDVRSDMVFSVGNDTEYRYGGYANTYVGGYSNTYIVGNEEHQVDGYIQKDTKKYYTHNSKDYTKLTVGGDDGSTIIMFPDSIRLSVGGSFIKITKDNITIKADRVDINP